MMRYRLTFFVFFLQCLFFVESGSLQDKLIDSRVIHITRATGLCRGKNAPLVTYYSPIICDLTSCLIQNQTSVIKEDIANNIKLTISISRCRSKENLDTCEDFFKRENLDYCKSINPDSIIISQSPLAVPLKPKFKCPLKKGVYQAINFTFNVAPLMFFNPDSWYWKINLVYFSPSENNRIIGCTNVEGYVAAKSKV